MKAGVSTVPRSKVMRPRRAGPSVLIRSNFTLREFTRIYAGLVAPGILPPATLVHPCTSRPHTTGDFCFGTYTNRPWCADQPGHPWPGVRRFAAHPCGLSLARSSARLALRVQEWQRNLARLDLRDLR